MSRFEDALDRQRMVRPPEALSSEMERAVMPRVLTSRIAAPTARRRSLAAAAACAAIVIALIVTSFPHRQPTHPPVAFVESVILLDDHVCIWLEPTNGVHGSSRP